MDSNGKSLDNMVIENFICQDDISLKLTDAFKIPILENVKKIHLQAITYLKTWSSLSK